MRAAVLALAAGLAAAPAFAAEPWSLDKSHAAITFQADHLGFSVVHGVFTEYDADILFDPENIDATEVSLTIAADSVNTFWERRDEHIRSADFLDVSEHPEITFVSTGVVQTSDTTAELTGDLTIIGETREVTFDVVLNKIGENPFNGQPIAGFTATTEIRRADWGMTYGGDAFAGVIPVRVDVEINPGDGSDS